MRHKDRVGGGLAQRFGLKILEQGLGAANRPQVEHHAGEHLRFRVRRLNPAREIVAPDAHRLPPARVRCHHVAGTIDIAAGVEPVADEPCQRFEIGHVGIGHAVIQKQTIVLIADAGLFLTPLRPAGQPEIGHRGRA